MRARLGTLLAAAAAVALFGAVTDTHATSCKSVCGVAQEMCVATAADVRTAALAACDAGGGGGSGEPDPDCLARCATCPDDCVATGDTCRLACNERPACITPCNMAEETCIAGCVTCEENCVAPPSDPAQCRADAEADYQAAMAECATGGSGCVDQCRRGVRQCLNSCTRDALWCIQHAKKDHKQCKRQCRGPGKKDCKEECVVVRSDAKAVCVSDFLTCTTTCRPR